MIRKIMYIIAMVILLQLVVVPASLAAGPSNYGSGYHYQMYNPQPSYQSYTGNPYSAPSNNSSSYRPSYPMNNSYSGYGSYPMYNSYSYGYYPYPRYYHHHFRYRPSSMYYQSNSSPYSRSCHNLGYPQYSRNNGGGY